MLQIHCSITPLSLKASVERFAINTDRSAFICNLVFPPVAFNILLHSMYLVFELPYDVEIFFSVPVHFVFYMSCEYRQRYLST